MVVKLRTSYLLPAELANIANTFVETVKASGISESLILRLLDFLEIDLDLLSISLTAVRTNEFIEEVAEAGAVLDDIFLAFRNTVEVRKRRRYKEKEVHSIYAHFLYQISYKRAK